MDTTCSADICLTMRLSRKCFHEHAQINELYINSRGIEADPSIFGSSTCTIQKIGRKVQAEDKPVPLRKRRHGEDDQMKAMKVSGNHGQQTYPVVNFLLVLFFVVHTSYFSCYCCIS